jgi:hypothetical protein
VAGPHDERSAVGLRAYDMVDAIVTLFVLIDRVVRRADGVFRLERG